MFKYLKMSAVLVLIMVMAVMALEPLPRPEDMTWFENLKDLLYWSLVYAFLTPIGWGVLVLLIVGLFKLVGHAISTVANTDYSRMTEDDKREELLNELRKCSERSTRV